MTLKSYWLFSSFAPTKVVAFLDKWITDSPLEAEDLQIVGFRRLDVIRMHFASTRSYNSGLPEARRAIVFDPELWKLWEGHSVDGVFPLEHCLGGTKHGVIFETQFQGQPAAIKLVPGSPEFIATRLASWESAATLSHPNLIKIFASEETMLRGIRCAYLVTQRADENLAEVLAERPLTPVETREMLLPVLSALRYLHAKGFVHGNLKPSNILASREQLKISADSVVAGTDTAGDCQAIGMLLEHALGGRDQSSALPEPFAEIAENCRNPDPNLRWDISRIEKCLRTNPRTHCRGDCEKAGGACSRRRR